MAARRSYTEQDKERFAEQRRDQVAELHRKLADNVQALNAGDSWQEWLTMAARFHRYSFNNVLLIAVQRPDATLVAGYRTWQAAGHQVRRGEKAIKVLGPVTKRVPVEDASGNPVRDHTGQLLYRRQLVGVKPVSVFDAAQVEPPVQQPPTPQLLTGQAPDGLWQRLAELVAANGYTLTRGDCGGGSNGVTHFDTREVRVRADLDDAQAVKTLAHELGHVLLPPRDGDWLVSKACRGLLEVEAESVAHMVTQAHGLDSGQYTFSYVTGWAAQAVTDDTTLADVLTSTGARVIGAVDKILRHTMPADTETALVDELAATVGADQPAAADTDINNGVGFEQVSSPQLGLSAERSRIPAAPVVAVGGPVR